MKVTKAKAGASVPAAGKMKCAVGGMVSAKDKAAPKKGMKDKAVAKKVAPKKASEAMAMEAKKPVAAKKGGYMKKGC